MRFVDNEVPNWFSQPFHASMAAAGVPVTAVPLRNGKLQSSVGNDVRRL